jgi:hypothetical protein
MKRNFDNLKWMMRMRRNSQKSMRWLEHRKYTKLVAVAILGLEV